MKFFNIDLHISVIADVKRIFNDLGHEVDDWTLSGHGWVFGRKRDKVDIIDHTNWLNLNKDMCDAFYKRYKDELNHYDGFICTHSPSFCLLYEKFKKPIITIAATRYEAPFWDDKQRWLWLNDYLQQRIDNGLIIPIANNKLDKKYCEVYTNREWKHIPSLCEYTESFYNPKQNFFIYSSFFPLHWKMRFNALIKEKRKALKPGYRWQDLAEFKGIIHIPFNASTMSIFEQYTSSMPMFFPSYEFMLKLRKSSGSRGVLNQLTWREVHNLSPGHIIDYDNNQIVGDINNYGNIEEEKEWIKLSDFYDQEWMPHIQYFNSFSELSTLLKTTNTNDISQKMNDFNKIRKQKIYVLWEEALKTII